MSPDTSDSPEAVAPPADAHAEAHAAPSVPQADGPVQTAASTSASTADATSTPAPHGAAMTPEAVAQQLKPLFPALFRGTPQPIKLRIQADIQQRAPGQFTKQALSAFLRRYTSSTSYLIALSVATQRFDLDGQPAGEVSEEHRQAALQELARRRANQQARREQEAGERRERAALLRDFQTTRLTAANFCALKGIAPEALDDLLALARKEAAEAPPAHDGGNRRGPRGPMGAGRPGGRPGAPRGPREGGRPSGPPGRRGGGGGGGKTPG